MTQPNLTAHAALRDGRPVTIRPLQTTDSEPLGAFFVGLSADTRRRYAPHPFDQATARQLCANVGADPCTRFVVVLDSDPTHPAIIGYLILTPSASPADLQRHGGQLRADASVGIAPAVADAFQNQGVGSLLGKHVFASARDMGMQQVYLSGGVRKSHLPRESSHQMAF